MNVVSAGGHLTTHAFRLALVVPFASALALVVPLASAAHAQLATVGPGSSTAPPAGTAPIRWPDVAYDTEHDVYLAVSGAGRIAGYWFAADGTPLDAPFVIDAGAPFAQGPRAVYADGVGFVVTWHETVPGDATRIRGRVVRYGEAVLPAPFDVSPVGTNWEMGATVAWSSASRELLVAWQSVADTRIGAQRVSPSGELLGAPIVADPRPLYFRDPAIAYHAATDTFFVAYAGCAGTNDCFVDVQRVRAGTGELVGPPIELDASIDAGYVPELADAPAADGVLVVWHRREAGGASFRSRLVAGDGTLAIDTAIVTDALGSYDANSLAYGPISGTFLFVTHGTSAQDVAIELSARGLALGAPIPFGSASAGGNFNPRVTANRSRAEWLAVTSTEFATLGAQRFATLTREPGVTMDGGVGDAGAPERDAATAAMDASAPGDASVRADAGRARPVSTGCGCRVERAARRGSHLVFGAVLALISCVGVRRARRSAASLRRARR